MNNYSSQKNDISQGSDGVFRVYKNSGETLAVLLRRFRVENNISEETKITYAGRLDPAAEGEMILLVGEERHKKELYLHKDKTYELSILFGITSDSLDLLGIPVKQKTVQDFSFNNGVLRDFLGDQTLPYPNYSSKPFEGRPLFMHARDGKEVPKQLKKVIIHSITLMKEEKITAAEVLQKVESLTQTVNGDFRQEAIATAWKEVLKDSTELFPVVTLEVTCSSGTYMRSLAEAIGEYMGIPALAFHIKRTKILD